MASALIHMVVAKKINEKLKLDERPFMLGSIAPDVAKIVGINRYETHFTGDKNIDVPNIRIFFKKYKDKLTTPFEIGYYIHLLTDVLWFGEFIKNFKKGNYVRDKEGNLIKFSEQEYCDLIYNDYTNLNEQLLDLYNLDLSLFYEKFTLPESNIDEVKSIYLGKLIDRMGVICSKTSNYSFLFDITDVSHFIEYATIYCLDCLKKDGII